jgi:hypothetical protein
VTTMQIFSILIIAVLIPIGLGLIGKISRKLWLWVGRISKVAVGVGVLLGGFAFWQYGNVNRIQSGGFLINLDRKDSKEIREDRHLHPIYAQPKITNKVATDLDSLLALSLDAREKRTLIFRNVPQLHEAMFQPNGFRNSDRAKLRQVFFKFCDILNGIEVAYLGERAGFLTDEDRETWALELYQIGRHPLFLAAIYDAHKYGWIEPSVLFIIKEKMTTPVPQFAPEVDGIRRVLSAVYPDMLERDWANTAVKNKPMPPHGIDAPRAMAGLLRALSGILNLSSGISAVALLVSAFTFYMTFLRRLKLHIYPGDAVRIVIAADNQPDSLNFMCTIVNDSPRTGTLHRLEIRIDGPDNSHWDFVWGLFYKYQTGGQSVEKESDIYPVAIPKMDSKLLFVGFQSTLMDSRPDWRPGLYRFVVTGWANKESNRKPSNMKSTFHISITEDLHRQLNPASFPENPVYVTVPVMEWERDHR